MQEAIRDSIKDAYGDLGIAKLQPNCLGMIVSELNGYSQILESYHLSVYPQGWQRGSIDGSDQHGFTE